MSCKICYNDFDHSRCKPYSLSNCPHTFCVDCLNKLARDECPFCKTEFKAKHPNLSLMELIPKSSHDKTSEEFEILLNQANNKREILKNVIDNKRDENSLITRDLRTQIRATRDDLVKLIDNSLSKLDDELRFYEESFNFTLDLKILKESSSYLSLFNESNEDDEVEMKKNMIGLQFVKTTIDNLILKFTNYNENLQFISYDKIDTETGCFGYFKDEKSFEHYDEIGLNFLHDGQVNGSLFFYEKAIKSSPTQDQINSICADILDRHRHRKMDNYRDVLKFYDLIINMNVSNPWPYYYRAELLKSLDMLPEAINSFTEALKLDPTNTKIEEAKKIAQEAYDDKQKQLQISIASNIQPKTKS